MNEIIEKIIKQIDSLIWRFPRAFLFTSGVITGLLIAFIF